MNTSVLIGIAAAIIILAVIFVIKKFVGKSAVDMVAAIMAFVKQKLIDSGITTENNNFDNILDYIVKALIYISAGSSATVDPAQEAAQGVTYIKQIATAAGISFTDADYTIITTILTAGFGFIKSLNISEKDNKKICKKVGVVYLAK